MCRQKESTCKKIKTPQTFHSIPTAMLQTLTISTTAMASSSSSSSSSKRNPNCTSSSSSSSSSSSCSQCNHSPSATLDLLILILVLFSCAFLIASSLSHVLRSLRQILPPLSLSAPPLPYLLGALLSLAASVALLEIARSCRPRPRCRNPRCRGMRRAAEFDVRLQTEDEIGAGSGGGRKAAGTAAVVSESGWREIEGLPWKGGQQGNNPDYECLRAELRRMAPPNGRAVLLFRARCGCPVAKLEGWGPRRTGRRHRKSMANLALEGGDR